MPTPKSKSSLEALAVLLLAYAVQGCGGIHHSSETTKTVAAASGGTAVQPTTGKKASAVEADGDHDAVSNQRYDTDDRGVLEFGSAASIKDVREVAALLERYYTVAAAGNGAKGCSLIYSVFAEAIVEDYGTSLGPRALKGKTCAVVMTKLFKQEHKQLAMKARTLNVTAVRVSGRRGIAVLSFRGANNRYISIQRERDTWKLDSLLDVKFA